MKDSAEEGILKIEVASLEDRVFQLREHIRRTFSGGTPERNAELRNLLTRLISTEQFFELFGCGNEYGYVYAQAYGPGNPVEFLEFLMFFIGHELLDDGSPGIGWHRYARGGVCSVGKARQKWVGNHVLNTKCCLENGPGAKPFVIANRDDYPKPNNLANIKEVLAVLDWLEDYHKEFLSQCCEFLAGEPSPGVGEEAKSARQLSEEAARKACLDFVEKVLKE